MEWKDVWRNADAIRVALQDVLIARSAAEWQTVLSAYDIPSERVVTLEEAIASTQLAEREYFTTSPDDSGVTLPLAGYKMSKGGPALQTSPPSLGRDTKEILLEAGLSEADISDLFDRAIAQ